MIPSVERFFKQAIVEREPGVVSAALVTAVHAFGENKEGVRRWVAEIQQALNAAASRSITQYHALGLLYLIKAGDRVALSKLVQQLNKASTNPLAVCLFLRIYAQQMGVSDVNLDLKPFLRHSGPKGEMVALEAARIICERPSGDDLDYAVTGLQHLLGSSKPVVQFAALRVLNELASRHPAQVATCNGEIEGLICHANRNIATLAITALLKTGDEAGVDRLVAQIRGYVGEISDEFKVIVVDAVRLLCLKFPARHAGILDFLGGLLREAEGTEAYKRATVDAVCQLLAREIPGVRDAALLHLAEFIEDSEYPALTAQILHVLGVHGPRAAQPSRLVRYVYNRLVLEGAPVRVAAVGALTRFAVALPALRHGILSILKRSLGDPDDAVRDRAAIALQGMDTAPALFTEAVVPDLELLEQQLLQYTSGSAAGKLPDLSQLPSSRVAEVFEQARQWQQERLVPSAAASPTASAGNIGGEAGTAPQSLVADIPEFRAYGAPFKAEAPPAPLTEPDTEYVVAVRKHLFPAHLVLEFVCTNTVPALLLSSVSAALTCPPGFQPLLAIPIPVLPHGHTRSAFVALARPQGPTDASFAAVLQFVAQECDPDSQEPLEAGFQDRYVLEAFDLGLPDFVLDRRLPLAALEGDWAGLAHEQTQTFALPSLQSLPDAVSAISDLFGLSGLGGSASVDPGSPVHTLLLAGAFAYEGNFAVRCRMALSRSSPGVNIELCIRAASPALIETLMESLS
jgi:coatomer protein complex subunit gamma